VGSGNQQGSEQGNAVLGNYSAVKDGLEDRRRRQANKEATAIWNVSEDRESLDSEPILLVIIVRHWVNLLTLKFWSSHLSTWELL
jgi:hypothetical protein